MANTENISLAQVCSPSNHISALYCVGLNFAALMQDLVMAARGKLKARTWRKTNGEAATTDDITVFVVPVQPQKKEFLQEFQQKQELEEEGVTLQVSHSRAKLEKTERERRDPVASICQYCNLSNIKSEYLQRD